VSAAVESPTDPLLAHARDARLLGMRLDNCFAEAVADCLDVPLSDVPDPEIDDRLEAGDGVDRVNRFTTNLFDEWLDSRGLEAEVWRTKLHSDGHLYHMRELPKRWVGVIADGGEFLDHCFTMEGPKSLEDIQIASLPAAYRNLLVPAVFTVAEINLGITFRPRKG